MDCMRSSASCSGGRQTAAGLPPKGLSLKASTQVIGMVMTPTMLSGSARPPGRRPACRRPSARASSRRRDPWRRRRQNSGWPRPRTGREAPGEFLGAVLRSDRGDVGGGEVGGVGPEHLVPQRVETRTELVPPGLERGGEATHDVGATTSPRRDSQLEGSGTGVGEELLRRPHRSHQRRRTAHPAHLPAGEGERLAARRDGEGALTHAGEGGEGTCVPSKTRCS